MKGRNLTEEDFIKYLISLDQKILSSIPEDKGLKFSEVFEKKMAKLIKNEAKMIPFVKYEKYIKIAAAILILTTSFSLIPTSTKEAFVERIVEIIENVFSDRTEIKLKAKGEGEEFRIIYPSYIPEGYIMIEENISVEGEYNYIVFENEKREQIRYDQSKINAMGVVLDTENLEEDEVIKYKGQEFRLIFKDMNYRVYWNDNNYVYWLDGYTGKEEIVKMTESIINESRKPNK